MTQREHADLLTAIQLALSKGDTRLFRMQAGVAWQGTIVERSARRLVLLNPRPVHMGPEGYVDLTGWTGPNARFLAIEAKTGKGRTTEAQDRFIELVKRSGGLAGVARSVEDALRILTP